MSATCPWMLVLNEYGISLAGFLPLPLLTCTIFQHNSEHHEIQGRVTSLLVGQT